MDEGKAMLKRLLGCILLFGVASTANAQAGWPKLPLVLSSDTLAVCRMAPDAPTPAWTWEGGGFVTVSRSTDELSMVVPQARVPAGVSCERDYRALRVRGPLAFDLVGILASMAGPLAQAGLSIFAISTYDTDYVMVKSSVLDSAIAVLQRAGHQVSREAPSGPAAGPSPQHASGTFDVKLSTQPAHPDSVGRMSIAKIFRGDLTGESKGEMLAVMAGVQGSAGYVAMERVTGSLRGRRGTFALQHSGTMVRGVPSLSVTVVPDSGTDQLAGLAGTMRIVIEGRTHSYEFDYTLPDAP